MYIRPELNLLGVHSRINKICVLQRQTEGRVPVFSHEVVPDHLRTKPDPEVEEQEKQLTTDAARIGADAAQVGLSHCPAAPHPRVLPGEAEYSHSSIVGYGSWLCLHCPWNSSRKKLSCNHFLLALISAQTYMCYRNRSRA